MMLLIFLLFAADVIDNPQTSGGIAALTLEADRTYGGEDGPIFSSNIMLAADQAGHLFVLDAEAAKVFVFNADGAMVREIGKSGQGPGEFGMAVNLTVGPDGNLAVFDVNRQRIHHYAVDGKYLGETKMPGQVRGVPIQPVILNDGSIIATTIQPGAKGETIYDLSRYDRAMKPVQKIVSLASPPVNWSVSGKPGFWVGFLKDQMELLSRGLPMAVAAGSEQFIVCEASEYGGTLYSQSGKKIGGFTKQDKAEPFTEESRRIMFTGLWDNLKASPLGQQLDRSMFQKALDTADLPASVTPITATFSTGDGFGILASYRYDRGEGRLDLYDAVGHHVARGMFKGKAQYLAGTSEYLYTAGPNEDDDIVVTRHRLNRQ